MCNWNIRKNFHHLVLFLSLNFFWGEDFCNKMFLSYQSFQYQYLSANCNEIRAKLTIVKPDNTQIFYLFIFSTSLGKTKIGNLEIEFLALRGVELEPNYLHQKKKLLAIALAYGCHEKCIYQLENGSSDLDYLWVR